MTPVALRAIGMMNTAGNWTGKYGIDSRAEFLADPEAQEKALTDYLDDTVRQLKENGSYGFIGMSVDGVHARFIITRAGLITAAHRQGAPATRSYLDRISRNGFASRGLGLTRKELAIETRLRTFSDASYE